MVGSKLYYDGQGVSGFRKSDFWPVRTDLDFLGQFYFAKKRIFIGPKITLSGFLSA